MSANGFGHSGPCFSDSCLCDAAKERRLQKAPESGALRKDDGKPAMALLDPVALEGLAAVLTFGSRKYAAHNWQKGMSWSRCLSSLLRHTFKFMAGEDIDEESGLPHVDHMQCNTMFLANYYRRHKGLDDRFKPAPTESK